MSWPALITAIMLMVPLAALFQWFAGATKDTFIRREPSPGSAWGSASLVSAIMATADDRRRIGRLPLLPGHARSAKNDRGSPSARGRTRGPPPKSHPPAIGS